MEGARSVKQPARRLAGYKNVLSLSSCSWILPDDIAILSEPNRCNCQVHTLMFGCGVLKAHAKLATRRPVQKGAATIQRLQITQNTCATPTSPDPRIEDPATKPIEPNLETCNIEFRALRARATARVLHVTMTVAARRLTARGLVSQKLVEVAQLLQVFSEVGFEVPAGQPLQRNLLQLPALVSGLQFADLRLDRTS